jgi:hypothetical protein
LFPFYHWRIECLDFGKKAREVVRRMGYREEEHFIRIRPEEKDGWLQIKGNVRDKTGGDKFRKGAL